MEAHGDQRWLVDCLTATLDTARDVRAFAEESLRQASLLPGYGAALTKVTINKEISFGLRQISFQPIFVHFVPFYQNPVLNAVLFSAFLFL